MKRHTGITTVILFKQALYVDRCRAVFFNFSEPINHHANLENSLVAMLQLSCFDSTRKCPIKNLR